MPHRAHNKLTQEQFLTQAREKHGGRYDYSQVVCKGSKIKVLIGCPVHGTMTQTPRNHLIGYGCRKCGLGHTAKKRTDDKAKFVAKAVATHGDSYDYSATVYKGSKNKVAVRCPKHGIFEQLPAIHVMGQGCSQCGRARQSASRTYSQADFIRLALGVHGNRYDYSQAVYIAAKKSITIACPEHGPFKQAAHNHLMGQRCKRCVDAQLAQRRTLGIERFIEVSEAVHGSRYDYSESVYKRGKAKVKIICPVHGRFEQIAGDHMNGHGCPSCASVALTALHRLSWIERAAGRLCTLYFLRFYTESESFYKVGITCQSVKIRYKSPTDLNGYSYEVVAQHTSQDAARIYDWEQSILDTFAHLHYRPKQPFGGATECFSSCEEILSIFPL